MEQNYRYYVHRQNGELTRIARLGGTDDDFGAYGWVDGKWEPMNGLWKIENEATDYEPVTEEEAMKLISGPEAT